jgi:hypothetical protein
MPNTLTFGEVRDGFTTAGYTLLTDRYINSKQKLVYRCPNGHDGETTWNTFHSRGRRCPQCYYDRSRHEKLTPIDKIRASFADRGYTLLTTQYTDGHQDLEAVCSRGHSYTTNFRKWNQGYGCSTCGRMGEHNGNWNPDREAVKQNRKVWTAWRNLLRAGVSGRNDKTSAEIRGILGFDWSELRRHVESHPDWEACRGNYHLDHIFPVKAFLDYGINDPSLINALDNLRPLSAAANFRKNKFYDRLDFERYLESKGIQWQKPNTIKRIFKS